ncbi:MAG: hypothetical protein KDC81_04650 [Flavobacteriaceae bacterium]|nr:hypothetical protein [Flavobacteriaceae bacterium]
MKTTFLKPALFTLLLTLFFNNLIAQNNFDASATLQHSSFNFESTALDNLQDEVNLYAFEETKPIDFYEIQDERSVAAILARAMFGFGAGIAFGENETIWCLQAAYYMQLSMFANSALYGALGLVYEGWSYDNFTRSLFDFQLKLLMFSALTRYKEVFLVYGILGAYGFGSEKYNNFNTDITRFTASLILGLNIILTTRLTLAIHTSMFSYQRYNYKPENGNDYNNSFSRFFLNKQNLVALTLLINLSQVQLRN